MGDEKAEKQRRAMTMRARAKIWKAAADAAHVAFASMDEAERDVRGIRWALDDVDRMWLPVESAAHEAEAALAAPMWTCPVCEWAASDCSCGKSMAATTTWRCACGSPARRREDRSIRCDACHAGALATMPPSERTVFPSGTHRGIQWTSDNGFHSETHVVARIAADGKSFAALLAVPVTDVEIERAAKSMVDQYLGDVGEPIDAAYDDVKGPGGESAADSFASKALAKLERDCGRWPTTEESAAAGSWLAQRVLACAKDPEFPDECPRCHGPAYIGSGYAPVKCKGGCK